MTLSMLPGFAESHTSESVFSAHLQCVSVAVSKVFLKFSCQLILYDRADNMDDLFRRQIICICQHRDCRRLLIVIAELESERVHASGAVLAQLHACICMDTVVDTRVHRDEAAEHLGIGRIDYSI